MNQSSDTVVVIGAGMVGVCCALELQKRGAKVTLIDRKTPGRETSYGNAGVFSTSSLVPFNNPTLFKNLPQLMRNKGVSFRYDPRYLMGLPGWSSQFLMNARQTRFAESAAALHALISLSSARHAGWLRDAAVTHRLRDTGWMFLYRDAAALEKGEFSRQVYEQYDISFKVLDRRQLADLEPHLAPVFSHGVWMDGTQSVDNPGAVVTAYADLFVAQGGRLLEDEVRAMTLRQSGTWRVSLRSGHGIDTGKIVLAAGPWSNTLLSTIGLQVPMAFERGYHMHYGVKGGATLGRPVYDTSGGYVLTPMEQGIRLGTGVEMNALDAPPDHTQLDLCEAAAHKIFPLAGRLETNPWLGRRPTLPDSRPIIGAVTSMPGLWLAFGHQHIGFSTSAGTGALLAALMYGDTPPIDPAPFRASRFLS